MMMAKGAAAISHSPQVMVFCSVFSMKPMATMFCAAAVLMPTFQMLAVCVVVIISMPAKALFLLMPKAAMMPSMIGTRQETRAVVDGTRKASTMPTSMEPATTLSGLGADAREDDQRDAPVEPGGLHGGGQEQRGGDQRQRRVGKAAEGDAERRAGAEQHLGIGDAGRGAEQEGHQRGDHDRRDGVVERFRHPHDDRERQHRQHALAGDRQSRGRRQQHDRDQRRDGEDQPPVHGRQA